MDEKQAEIEKLQRQLERLQRNFTKMVKDSEEADKMLDWINDIRKRLKKLTA
jgi:uncharacterized coiled-coil DUF342 family protein